MITKAKAKKITIEVWTYFAEHPEIRAKEDLPKKLYNKIKSYVGECPICEYFSYHQEILSFLWGGDCEGCPLKIVSRFHCPLYHRWAFSRTKKERSKAAWDIVDRARSW